MEDLGLHVFAILVFVEDGEGGWVLRWMFLGWGSGGYFYPLSLVGIEQRCLRLLFFIAKLER